MEITQPTAAASVIVKKKTAAEKKAALAANIEKITGQVVTAVTKTMCDVTEGADVVNLVYVTNDYSKFKFHHTNRFIDAPHATKMKKSVGAKNLTKDVPITVDKDGNVIDGQHRATICIALGLPIYYTIALVATIEDIAILNANKKLWTLEQSVMSWAAKGNPEYKKLIDFSINKGITISNALVCMSYNNGQSFSTNKSKNSDMVRFGHFVFPTTDDHEVIINRATEIQIAINGETTPKKKLIETYKTFIHGNPDYDHVNMLKKLSMKVVAVKSTSAENATMLENVYNLSLHEKKRISFRSKKSKSN